MADWWHSVPFQMIVAAAAYLGGVITKPLQNYIETKQKEKRLQNALYVESASNLNFLGRIYRETEGKKGKFPSLNTLTPFLCFECFEDAAKQPTLLNQLREASHFRRLYSFLATLKSFKEIESEAVWGICETLFTVTGGLIANKTFKAKRLLKLLNPQAKGYLVEARRNIREKSVKFDPV